MAKSHKGGNQRTLRTKMKVYNFPLQELPGTAEGKFQMPLFQGLSCEDQWPSVATDSWAPLCVQGYQRSFSQQLLASSPLCLEAQRTVACSQIQCHQPGSPSSSFPNPRADKWRGLGHLLCQSLSHNFTELQKPKISLVLPGSAWENSWEDTTIDPDSPCPWLDEDCTFPPP